MNSITREEAKRKVGEGWHSLIDEVYDAFDNSNAITVFSVKEKFGGLRIYIEPADNNSKILEEGFRRPDVLWEYFTQIIDKVEQQSYHICETCGHPGVLRNQRWMKTLCDRHCNGSPPLLPYTHPQTAQLDLFGDLWGVRPNEY